MRFVLIETPLNTHTHAHASDRAFPIVRCGNASTGGTYFGGYFELGRTKVGLYRMVAFDIGLIGLQVGCCFFNVHGFK